MNSNDVLKGALCGLAGGVAATIAKTVWEEYFPVRDKQTKTPPAILAERVTETDLTEREEGAAEQGIHATFGVGTGVLYGTVAEALPAVTVAGGLPFGAAFYGATHGSLVPALGLEPWPTENKPEYVRNELAGHFVYAAVLELVRRGMRRYVVQ